MWMKDFKKCQKPEIISRNYKAAKYIIFLFEVDVLLQNVLFVSFIMRSRNLSLKHLTELQLLS